MKTTTISLHKPTISRSVFLDLIALAFIYFAPSFSHLVSMPVYMMEPMRLMLVLSMIHSGKFNSFILALTLPLFSFLVSSHPAAGKMLIITAELVLNVFLFYFLMERIRYPFFAMISSIILSKITAYTMYLVFFSPAFVRSETGITFVLVQLMTTIIFSIYAGLFLRITKTTD